MGILRQCIAELKRIQITIGKLSANLSEGANASKNFADVQLDVLQEKEKSEEFIKRLAERRDGTFPRDKYVSFLNSLRGVTEKPVSDVKWVDTTRSLPEAPEEQLPLVGGQAAASGQKSSWMQRLPNLLGNLKGSEKEQVPDV